MNASTIQYLSVSDNAPPLFDVFHERCKARARLVAAGMMSLQDAVDGLQAAAIEYGLIADLGVDQVQAQMAAYFRDVPR